MVSVGFLGDQPGDGLRRGQWLDSPAGAQADRALDDADEGVTRALARARLRRFVERPVVPPAMLTAFGLTGLALS